MCTYQTMKIQADGSAKGATGWFCLTNALVYVDHAVHASYTHTVNIDFINPAQGPGARVAVELTEEAARALATAILDAVAAAPAGLASANQ
jgi:hypothetical protein